MHSGKPDRGLMRCTSFVRWMVAAVFVCGLSACQNADDNAGQSGSQRWTNAAYNYQGESDASVMERGMVAASDPIALRIAESADKAALALQDLARVEQTRRPPTPEPPPVAGPSELHTQLTIDWVGPAEPLVRNIASRLKYDVVVTGTTPAVPVVVQIHQRDREVLEALRNIGEQATASLDLVVDPVSKKIEIRYIRPEATQS